MTIRVLKKDFETLEIIETITFVIDSFEDVPKLLDNLEKHDKEKYNKEFFYQWEVIKYDWEVK